MPTLESIVARFAGATAVYRLASSRGAHAAEHGLTTLVEHGPGSARLRCSEAHADAAMRCLRRQAWLLCTIAHARGTRASLREDRCVASGGPACEYVVSWTARPRVLAVATLAAVVALAVTAMLPGPRRSVAWTLVPAVALAAYAVERRRCSLTTETSSAASAAAFCWLVGEVDSARADAPAVAETSLSDGARHEANDPGMPVLNQEGEFWRIAYRGTAVMLRHSRGIALLAHLVRCPGQHIHVRDLDAMTPSGGAALPRREGITGDVVVVTGDVDEALDRRALDEYRRRMVELRAEIDDADAKGDPARVEALRGELEMLADEVQHAAGIVGRVRRVPVEVERLRVAITRRIRSAIVKIAEYHPELGRHLETHVSTGYTCIYEPG